MNLNRVVVFLVVLLVVQACWCDKALSAVTILGSWVSGTSHAVEPGTDRALIFTVHVEDDDTNMNASVKYGGQSMTKITEQNYGTGYRAYVAAFILDQAGIYAASGSTFDVTWSQTPSRTPEYSSVFLGGVDQSDLTGATAGNGGASGTISTSALSTLADDMVIVVGTCGSTGTYSVNNGFTKGIELTVDSGDGVAGYKAATGANETPSITHSNPNRQAIIGFVVNAGEPGPPDTDPPTPDPMTWATLPHATSSSSISMTATTATDPSGAEYYFECLTSGGHDSGWQSSSSYTDIGLGELSSYTYRVKARDKSPAQNETGWSTSESATTPEGEPALIPWPTSISIGAGTLTITESNQILYADAELEDLANIFAYEISACHGISLSTASGSSANPGDILLTLVTDPLLTGEKYRLTVDTYVTIEAESIEGIFPGTTTLLQAMTPSGSDVKVPEMIIFDEPFRKMRSHMIDMKNYWHEVDTFKMFIRMCRFYKIRHLSLHSGEWQWIGAVMDQTSGIPYSERRSYRIYTKEEMEDLIAYGKAHGVYLYPHNESVPHYGGMFDALETDYNSYDGYDNFMDEWDGLGPYTHNGSSPSTRYWNFIEEVTHRSMDQFAAGFPDGKLPYYHVGPVQGEGGMDRTTAATLLGYITDHDADTKMAFWNGISATTSDSLSSQKSNCLVFYYDNEFGGSSAEGYVNNGWEIINSAWSPLYIARLRTQQQVYEDWNMFRQGSDGIPGEYEDIIWEFFDNPATNHLVTGANMSTWEQPEATHIERVRLRLPAYAEHAWHHKPWPYPSGDYPDFEDRYQTADILLERILTGATGDINVSPMSHDFGEQDVDAGKTANQQIIITNVDGANSILISDVSLTGTDVSHFIIDSDTGESLLAPGQSRTVEIYFDPFTSGTKLANLTILSNDVNEPQVDVSLTGEGIVFPIITDVNLNSSGNIEITYGKPDRRFTVESSTSPYDYNEENMTWIVEATGLSSGTWEDTGTPSTGEKYYRLAAGGELIAYEPFDYTDGSDIGGFNGYPEMWGGAWSSTEYLDECTVYDPGLSYPDLSSQGNSLKASIWGSIPAQRQLKESISSGTYWMSFLLKKYDQTGDFYVMINNEDMMVGLWGANSAWLGYDGTFYDDSSKNIMDGNAHLLVLRLDFNVSSLDAYLWIDPNMALGEPAAGNADASITNPNAVVWQSLQIYSSAGPILMVDEFRIGESWDSVLNRDLNSAHTVGMMVTSLVVGRNIVSSPFEPYPDGGIAGGGDAGTASIDKIVGDQLTGHPVSQWAADKIEAWDADLQTYVGAWLRSGQGWTEWDAMDTPPAFGIDSDEGYWVKINNIVKDVKLFGRVAEVNRSVEMKMNRNMVGSCFPVSCPLTESNLVGSGFNGHAVSQWASDKLEFWNTAGQTYVGVWYRSGQGWRAWDSMDNPPVTPNDAFDPCEGWWIKVNNTPFTWTYKAPLDRGVED